MVDAKTMYAAIAVTDGFGEGIVEFLVKLVIGIDSSHRQKQAAETSFEKEAILFVRDASSNLAAHLIEGSFAHVQSSGDFLFKHLKLPQLIKPLLTCLLVGTFIVNTFLHELNNFFIQQPHLYDFTLP